MHQISASGAIRSALLPTTLAVASIFASLSLSVPGSGPVAAVFPPWWEGARALRAASIAGRIAGFGTMPFVVIVQPETDGARAQLRSAGAWILLDPRYLVGCNSTKDD